MNRLLVFLCCTMACATLTKPSLAELTIRDAPQDLQVLNDGQPVQLEKVAGEGDKTVYRGEIGYKTERLTLRTHGQERAVDLDTRIGVGYLVIDYLLFVFPIAVDFVTGKWRSFEDLSVKQAFALAVPKAEPPANASQSLGNVDAAIGRLVGRSGKGSESPPLAQSPSAKQPLLRGGKLAVLDFKNYTKDLKPEDVRYFTDVVRGASLKAAPGVEVMTRENLLVLLQSTGKDPSQCEGECEVDTGRRVGADAIISGDILKVGTRFKLSLRLHETHDGRLLSTSVGSGATIDELDEGAQKAARDLLTNQ